MALPRALDVPASKRVSTNSKHISGTSPSSNSPSPTVPPFSQSQRALSIRRKAEDKDKLLKKKMANSKTTSRSVHTIRCPCSIREENGHMIECEFCNSWCHNNCVSISPSVAPNYPFVCPFCIKSTLLKIEPCISELRSFQDCFHHLKSKLLKLSLPPSVQSDIIELKSSVEQLSLKFAVTPDPPVITPTHISRKSSTKSITSPSIPISSAVNAKPISVSGSSPKNISSSTASTSSLLSDSKYHAPSTHLSPPHGKFFYQSATHPGSPLINAPLSSHFFSQLCPIHV